MQKDRDGRCRKTEGGAENRIGRCRKREVQNAEHGDADR